MVNNTDMEIYFYHKPQKLSERKVLQFTVFYPNACSFCFICMETVKESHSPTERSMEKLLWLVKNPCTKTTKLFILFKFHRLQYVIACVCCESKLFAKSVFVFSPLCLPCVPLIQHAHACKAASVS